MKKSAPTLERATKMFEDLLSRRGIRRPAFGVEQGPDEIDAPRSDESEDPEHWTGPWSNAT